MNQPPSLLAPRSNIGNTAHFPLFNPSGGTPTFSDVPASNVFFVSIETAHEKGIIVGRE